MLLLIISNAKILASKYVENKLMHSTWKIRFKNSQVKLKKFLDNEDCLQNELKCLTSPENGLL